MLENKTIITINSIDKIDENIKINSTMEIPEMSKVQAKSTMSQMTLVAKFCKALPKNYRIDQEGLNMIIGTINYITNYNNNIAPQESAEGKENE